MGVVIEEADETVFWLELLVESGIMPELRLNSLMSEANELVAIFVSSQKKPRRENDHDRVMFTRSPDHPITRSERFAP